MQVIVGSIRDFGVEDISVGNLKNTGQKFFGSMLLAEYWVELV
tara:strand:- start:304 stop:432 length:129 start_codon:yes stop_codon:yes gene_type:complete